MKMKGAPVHSIEPQIMEAALQAKADGVEMMVAADGSDLVFGGMDRMLSKDWKFEEWVDFYTFLDPKIALKNPVDMSYLLRDTDCQRIILIILSLLMMYSHMSQVLRIAMHSLLQE